MTTESRNWLVKAREVELHETDLQDSHGRKIQYEVTIEALVDPDAPYAPVRVWRLKGRQLRNGRALGRGSSPLHVYSIREARTMATTLFHKHVRYVQRHVAAPQVRAAAAEEDLNHLAERI